MPKSDYIVIPQVSSENRDYIPIGFMSLDVICSDKLRIVNTSSLYHFGVLTSSVHMAWMRAVGGRLKSDYSYSNDIVYNNFIWPNGIEGEWDAPQRWPNEREGERLAPQNADKMGSETLYHREGSETLPLLEKTAQKILDVRAKYKEKSLAELYNKATMPNDLLEAHKENDRVVMEMYGFETGMSEEEIVGRLMKMYEERIKNRN